MNTNMEQKTTGFYNHVYKILDVETAKFYLNKDGSETMGNINFPRIPLVVETDSHWAKNLYAVFTTVEDFIQNPSEDFKPFLDRLRERKREIGVNEIVNALYWYVFQEHNVPLDVYYTIFEDGTLVYAYEQEVKHE